MRAAIVLPDNRIVGVIVADPVNDAVPAIYPEGTRLVGVPPQVGELKYDPQTGQITVIGPPRVSVRTANKVAF